LFSDADSDAFVFQGRDGGHITYSNWRQRIWEPACRAVGAEGLGFDDLRRLSAAELVVETIDRGALAATAPRMSRLTLPMPRHWPRGRACELSAPHAPRVSATATSSASEERSAADAWGMVSFDSRRRDRREGPARCG